MSAPFLQLYVGDYLADTTDLTCEEHGAYLLLLMTMWRHGAKLPNDRRKLARVARMTPGRFGKVWDSIGRFFTDDGEHIRNNRLTKEHAKATEKSEIRARCGSMGGKAKALKENDPCLAKASVLPKQGQKTESDIEKGEPNGSPKKKRGHRLSEAWALPKDWGEWAVEQGLPPDVIRHEAEKFRDYWISQPGQKGVKLDWQATWRNWIRNAAKHSNVRPFPAGGRRHDRAEQRHREDAAIDEYIRRRASGEIDLGPDRSDPFAGR